MQTNRLHMFAPFLPYFAIFDHLRLCEKVQRGTDFGEAAIAPCMTSENCMNRNCIAATYRNKNKTNLGHTYFSVLLHLLIICMVNYRRYA